MLSITAQTLYNSPPAGVAVRECTYAVMCTCESAAWVYFHPLPWRAAFYGSPQRYLSFDLEEILSLSIVLI